MREAHAGVALVMLTAAGEAVDRIVGLELGADDYLPKPFEMRELLARIRAVLRRTRVDPGVAAAALAATAAALASTATAQGATATARSAAVAAASQRVRFGACTLDLERRKLFGAQGQEVDITAAEFDLLWLFARHPNRPLNRDQIMEQAH